MELAGPLRTPLGLAQWPWEAQSSPRVARESWGWRSRPGPLLEGNTVGEGTTRRGTATPVHRPQRPAGKFLSRVRLFVTPWSVARQAPLSMEFSSLAGTGGQDSSPGWGGLLPRAFLSAGTRRHGNPLQYSCLENPMDRGAWRATDHGVAKSQTRPSD